MAGFDTSMYSQIKPIEMQNPLAMAVQAAQIQGFQDKNELSRLVLGEKQREVGADNALAELIASKAKPDDVISGLAAKGYGAKALSYQKLLKEQQKADADLGKTKGETEYKAHELASKRYDTYKKTLGALSQDPNLSKDMVIQSGQELVQQGILPMEMYQNAIGNLPDDPVQLRARLRQGVAAQLSPEQMLTVFAPKPTQIDNGQQIGFRDTNPNSPTYGQATGGAPVQKLRSPDNIATVNASMANASATREAAATTASATRDAAKIKGDRDAEMKLADDYNAQSKAFKEVGDAYRTINATLDKATTSAAATLAGATKFMKLLDPGSVVRESELGMALAATGVFDRATNYFNTLQRGKVLTKSQATDFKNITEQIYKAAQDGQRKLDASYRSKAQTYKLRPDMIIQDLGQVGGGADILKAADEILGR